MIVNFLGNIQIGGNVGGLLVLGRLTTYLYECKIVRLFGNFPGYFGKSFKGAGGSWGLASDVSQEFYFRN